MTPPIDLHRLFRDPRMFDSKDRLRSAGFDVKQPRGHNVMVASHASVPGCLFKKYDRRTSPDEQRENYERRVEGARRLRAFIDAKRLRHVTVPKKWIVELPRDFRSRHLLVVERMQVVSPKENERRYRGIDADVLRELCVVLHAFRGLDSAIHNVWFVRSGQIAFIDTENWNRPKSKVLYFIRQHLSGRSERLADRMFQKLSRGEVL